MSTEDQALVGRASRGDVEAFSKLVRAHSALVRGLTLRMLGGQEAQDASQEVWVRVWANIKSFRGESAFSTWLHRITVNTCLSYRRKESRRRTREVGEDMAHLSEPSGRDADPEEAALDAERRGEIQVALGNVRAEHRAAMVMRHMDGLSCAEISEVLGVPDGTVKGWASRGRAAMLAALTQGSTERIIHPLDTVRKTTPRGAPDGAPGPA
jgi:RNA polymerase sigma-70 factor, ECF subfamily